jgi:TGF-beta propeptide
MTSSKIGTKIGILWFSVIFVSLLTWKAAYAQITPLGDSYTNTADPTANYGAQKTLDVDGASQTTYIQFNLGSVPSTASVSQATLKLYVNSVTTAGSFNVDYINGSWSESKIDASNAPPLGAAIASNVSVTTADKNQYILVNVTSAVQAWLNGSETNNGLALVANSSFNATFDSKENTTTSHPAELDIAFAGGDGTITGVTTASGSGLTGGGTSGTLNLSLTSACAANQVLQWNGSAWACAAVGTGTITGVTAGTDLTGGGTSGNVTLNLNTANVPLLTANNTFTGNNVFNPSSATDAIDAYASNPGNAALVGLQSATSGGSYGVYAYTFDWSGAGVSGTNYTTATGSVAPGVFGNSTNGFGVYGTSTNGVGVYGSSQDDVGTGVFGIGSTYGVQGEGTTGVYGVSLSQSGPGVYGNGSAYGVYGLGDTYGVLGQSGSSDGSGGGFSNSTTGDALFTYNQSGGYAAFFDGNVDVDGKLSKAGGSFKIDHPLDPANKYLYHSFVESPDMKNIYDGVATLDANGEAVIQMPDWFGVLNRDFRYQLTCIGGFAPVYIAEKLANNQFKIGGGKPGMEVSWQITGIRQDAWANANRIPVEEEKEAKLKGFYLHPQLYGAPAEKGIEWARHPEMMKKLLQSQEQMKEKRAGLTESARIARPTRPIPPRIIQKPSTLIPPAALPHRVTK